jgi:hypothetical protein
LAKNDLSIKVFVDNKIDGSFIVKNDKSGTANFSYQIKRPLTKGQHWVYTTTLDKRGKASGQSNIIKLNYDEQNVNIVNEVKPVQTPEIDEKADNGYEADKQEPATKVPAIDKPAIEDDNEKQTEKTLEENEIKELIKNSTSTKTVNTGTIDESNTQQSKIKLNLIIFILFLVAVIAWIFWVNRELIKEKNAQSEVVPDEKKKSE